MARDLLKDWFGVQEVIVGKPLPPHDNSHTLPTGDSVVAVNRAMREYEEETRRNDRLSAFCSWMTWAGGFLLFVAVFAILGPFMHVPGWLAFVMDVIVCGGWILLWGRVDPYNGV